MTEDDPKQFYKILGLNSSANQNDIKKAYRKLSLKWHPDKGGDLEKFKKISVAYDTLSSLTKRMMYDFPDLPPLPEEDSDSENEDGHASYYNVNYMPQSGVYTRESKKEEEKVAKSFGKPNISNLLPLVGNGYVTEQIMMDYEEWREKRYNAFQDYIDAKRGLKTAIKGKEGTLADGGDVTVVYVDDRGNPRNETEEQIKKRDEQIKEKDKRRWEKLWQFSLAHNEMRTIEKGAELPKKRRLAFTSTWTKQMTGRFGIGGDTIRPKIYVPEEMWTKLKTMGKIPKGGRRKKTRKKRRRKNKRKTKRRKKTRRRKKRRKKRRTKRR